MHWLPKVIVLHKVALVSVPVLIIPGYHLFGRTAHFSRTSYLNFNERATETATAVIAVFTSHQHGGIRGLDMTFCIRLI